MKTEKPFVPKKAENTTYRAKTVLGKETVFSGVLRFDESLKINGRFEGSIESDGFLVVENGAEIIANVRVANLVVGGHIHGDVWVTERLELLSSGCIDGNVHAPNLVMAEGSGILGRCEMLADSSSGVDIFSMHRDMLKKTIARVE